MPEELHATESGVVVPAIQQADIDWVQEIMGVTFDGARREVLLSNECFDVQACPGSGKTTLLVAKLAILARHWKHPYRGLCVLSHTNVARQEIESRLAGSSVSSKLLDYPHFVGTIQTFVDEFLALPMLKSEGYHVTQIDNVAHSEFCKRLLNLPAHSACKTYLANSDSQEIIIGSLKYVGTDLELKANRSLPSSSTASYQSLSNIKQQAASAGLWPYDDMFAWAARLIDRHPGALETIHQRFPVVFMDEAQDTSSLQSNLLSKVFPADQCVVRQRFGDGNQAIYDYDAAGAQEIDDPFPADSPKTVPTSKRFGRSIADKARAVAPNPELVGDGPARALADAPAPDAIQHTVFTFLANSAQLVIPAFGDLLLRTFSDQVIKETTFVAKAIGRVGKQSNRNDNSPRHLREYWTDFVPGSNTAKRLPTRMADFVHAARSVRATARDTRDAANQVFRGLVELVERNKPGTLPRGFSSGWRIRTALRNHPDARAELNSLLWDWCVSNEDPTEARWTVHLTMLNRAVAPLLGADWDPLSDSFCAWSDKLAIPTPSGSGSASLDKNCYVHESGGRRVPIHVGTVHGAKGQTHTATIVLDTYVRVHDLKDLLDWITAKKQGAGRNEGKMRVYRMRLNYTAMTRPSHLLCLALRRDFLGEPGPDNEARRRLADLGWTVVDLDT